MRTMREQLTERLDLDAAESRASFDGGGVPAGTSPLFWFVFWF
jgi:hypothetical protein